MRSFPETVNREDGRSGQPAETNAAFASVLLSQANGKYSHINVGVENWYHSAGIVNGGSGPEIWLGGYFQSSGTIFRDATTQVASGFGYSLDNATGTLKKAFPKTYDFIPDSMATLDSDTPDMKRQKNIREDIGLGFVTDLTIGSVKSPTFILFSPSLISLES